MSFATSFCDTSGCSFNRISQNEVKLLWYKLQTKFISKQESKKTTGKSPVLLSIMSDTLSRFLHAFKSIRCGKKAFRNVTAECTYYCGQLHPLLPPARDIVVDWRQWNSAFRLAVHQILQQSQSCQTPNIAQNKTPKASLHGQWPNEQESIFEISLWLHRFSESSRNKTSKYLRRSIFRRNASERPLTVHYIAQHTKISIWAQRRGFVPGCKWAPKKRRQNTLRRIKYTCLLLPLCTISSPTSDLSDSCTGSEDCYCAPGLALTQPRKRNMTTVHCYPCKRIPRFMAWLVETMMRASWHNICVRCSFLQNAQTFCRVDFKETREI